ncbi:hypothetical protein D3C78_876650 [compost metagenome]
MGQRGQIARRANGTFRRDPRIDLSIHQRNQRLNHAQPDAGKTARQAVDFQHHHQAHHIVVQRSTYACGMRQHQRALEIFQVVRSNARLRQQAKTSVNPICGTVFCHDRFDAGHALVDGFMRFFIQCQRGRVTPDVAQLFQRQRARSKG